MAVQKYRATNICKAKRSPFESGSVCESLVDIARFIRAHASLKTQSRSAVGVLVKYVLIRVSMLHHILVRLAAQGPRRLDAVATSSADADARLPVVMKSSGMRFLRFQKFSLAPGARSPAPVLGRTTTWVPANLRRWVGWVLCTARFRP